MPNVPYGRRSWSYYVDPDLRIFHSDRSCTAAKMAAKYNTLQSAAVVDGDEEAASELLLRGRPCPACKTREAKRPAERHPASALPGGPGKSPAQ